MQLKEFCQIRNGNATQRQTIEIKRYQDDYLFIAVEHPFQSDDQSIYQNQNQTIYGLCVDFIVRHCH